MVKFNEDKIREMKLEEDSLNFVNVLRPFSELLESERSSFPLLSMVEPYDNTFLNFLQCQLIIKEIKKLLNLKEILDIDKILDRLNSVSNFEYIVLRGD